MWQKDRLLMYTKAVCDPFAYRNAGIGQHQAGALVRCRMGKINSFLWQSVGDEKHPHTPWVKRTIIPDEII